MLANRDKRMYLTGINEPEAGKNQQIIINQLIDLFDFKPLINSWKNKQYTSLEEKDFHQTKLISFI